MRSWRKVLWMSVTAIALGGGPALVRPSSAGGTDQTSTKLGSGLAAEIPVHPELRARPVPVESGTPSWELTPSVLGGQEAIYDSLQDRMLVEQGDDVWEMPLTNPRGWSRLEPSNNPPGGLVAHAYDSKRGRILSIRSQGRTLVPFPWAISNVDESPDA
jgi:hypothetical protein